MKVFAVGLDGAVWELLQPWLDEGRLPFLKRMQQQGTWGDLRSTYPPLTAPAWASFMTGKNPGNHGIYDFFYRRPGSYGQAVHNVTGIKELRLWEILSAAGDSVGVVNLPLTYPPDKVNGFLIAGLLTPYNKNDFAYPAEILTELEEKVGPYLLHHDQTGDLDSVLDQEFEILEYRAQSIRYLYQHHPKDFFMVHFFGTDRLQHEIFHVLDPKHPMFDQKTHDKYYPRLLEYYQAVDRHLEGLCSMLDGDTLFLVMSDHGFTSIHKWMDVNIWLLREGFLHLKWSLPVLLRRFLFRCGFTYTNIAKLILKMGLGRMAVRAGRGRRQQLQEKFFLSLRDVDWGRTQAYSIGNFGEIFINLQGREPNGSVWPEQYQQVCRQISHRLQQLTDPGSGENVVAKVFDREEIFAGKFSATAPDIFFLTQDMKIKPNGLSDFTSRKVLEDTYASTGHHNLNGIVMVYLPGTVPTGVKIDNARITDIAPTILYIMGKKVPDDMDGRVLLEILEKQFSAGRPVEYSDARQQSPTETTHAEQQDDPEDQEAVKETLTGMGYL